MSHPIDAARIVASVRSTYGVPACGAVPVPGRAHAEAKPYRIESDDRAVWFLKLSTGNPGRGLRLARFLATNGVAEVLAPLPTREGRLTTRIGSLWGALYPFVDGANAFQAPLTDVQWSAFGTALRRAHDARPPRPLALSLRRERYAGIWRRKVRVYLDAAAMTPADDRVTRGLFSHLTAHRERIEALVGHAERLAASLRRKQLPFVPCHGDVHAGNLVIVPSGGIFIVDWDDPLMAPKERDLMFVGGGVGGAWNRPEESAAFYQGYGDAEIDREALAYYRCDRIVEDIAVFYEELVPGDDDPNMRRILFERLAAQFNERDVVEMAEQALAETSPPT